MLSPFFLTMAAIKYMVTDLHRVNVNMTLKLNCPSPHVLQVVDQGFLHFPCLNLQEVASIATCGKFSRPC